MIGGEHGGAGVMVLTMRDLFQRVEDLKSEKKIKISIAYLEIYNETIRDLFIPNSPALMLCEDPIKGPTVSGLTEKKPKTADEVFQLLEYGNENRRQSPTEANARSSRSHAILQITVQQKDRTGDVSAEIRSAKLSLIDLAGSERAAVSQNRGDRLKEGANINRSLLALGNCINSLGENYKKGVHVPYRNSKLTRLLKDSLGGNCKTVMIANISPYSNTFEDTLNTLKYANRAKNIKTKVTKNVVNVNYHISKYTQIISDLRKEVLELKEQLSNQKLFSQNENINTSNTSSITTNNTQITKFKNSNTQQYIQQASIKEENERLMKQIEEQKNQISQMKENMDFIFKCVQMQHNTLSSKFYN
jgi:kinesin family protein 18/19